MQTLALIVSTTLLTLTLLLIGINNISPNFVKGIMNRINPVQTNEEIIFDDFENNTTKSTSNKSGAVILGETTEAEPKPTTKPPVQQYYQPPKPLPTATPTQEPVAQQEVPWADFANKEAYCKNFAQTTLEDPKNLEIAKEYYDKLINSIPTPLPGQDPSTYLSTPTFSQYYEGLKSDVYKVSYNECLKSYQNY